MGFLPLKQWFAPAMLAAATLVAAPPSTAHGPTVRLTYGGPKPAQLTIVAGQTVHFQNGGTTSRSFTVVADDGSFEGPTLARGGGWHHTFETPGSFGYHVREQPDRRGKILVVPAE